MVVCLEVGRINGNSTELPLGPAETPAGVGVCDPALGRRVACLFSPKVCARGLGKRKEEDGSVIMVWVGYSLLGGSLTWC